MARRYSNNVIYLDDNRARDFVDPVLMGLNNYFDGLAYAKRIQNDDRARTQADLNAMESLNPAENQGNSLLNAANSLVTGKYDAKGIFGLGTKQGSDPYNLMGTNVQSPVPFVNGEITPGNPSGWSQAISERYGIPTTNNPQQPLFVPEKSNVVQIPVMRTEQQLQETTSPGFNPQGLTNIFAVSGGDIAGLDPRFSTAAEYFLTNNLTPEERSKISLTSGYRNPERNAAAGGVKNSFHLTGQALDADLSHLSPERREEVVATARANGFNDALYHDVGSGYHLHLGGDQYKDPTGEQKQTTVTSKNIREYASVDVGNLPDRTKTYQDAKKVFLQERLAQLNDKNLSTAEKNAIARGRKDDLEQFDKRFDESWQTKANEAIDLLDERLSTYLYGDDRVSAMAAARYSDSVAKRLKIDRPSMTSFINELNPVEKLQPFDDGATSGFMAYNPMTGETRIVSSMEKKLSQKDLLNQSNEDRRFYADQEYRAEDLKIKQYNAVESQKAKRMQQIANGLKMLFTKDDFGKPIPMPGKEKEIEALQKEYMSLNDIGTPESTEQVPSTPTTPQYGSFADYKKGKRILTPEEQQAEDLWNTKNRTAFRQGYNSLYAAYSSGQDPTAEEQQWIKYARSIGVDPEPAIQAAREKAASTGRLISQFTPRNNRAQGIGGEYPRFW